MSMADAGGMNDTQGQSRWGASAPSIYAGTLKGANSSTDSGMGGVVSGAMALAAKKRNADNANSKQADYELQHDTPTDTPNNMVGDS